MTPDVWRRSPLVFLFVTVFVDMIGYGIVVPLLPFYAGPYASGAVLVGLLGSLYAAMQFVGGPFLGGLSEEDQRMLGFGNKTNYVHAYERKPRHTGLQNAIKKAYEAQLRIDEFRNRVKARLNKGSAKHRMM